MTLGDVKGSKAGGPPFSNENACFLAKLADLRLSGLLPGLLETDGFLEADTRAWGCCGGSGFRERQETSFAKASVLSCDLSRRLRMVRDIYARYAASFPEDKLSLSPPSQALGPFLERLRLISSKGSRLGLCLLSAEGMVSPITFWQVALTAAWRFGLTAHVVDLKKTEIKDFLPSRARDVPQIILVEGVARLWEPAMAERFELLVQYCYGGLIPLFIRVTSSPEASSAQRSGARPAAGNPGSPAAQPKGPSSLKAAFGARIARARTQITANVLSADVSSKLRATTSGIDSWLGSSF